MWPNSIDKWGEIGHRFLYKWAGHFEKNNAGCDNLMGAGDPWMDGGKLESNILFGFIEFEVLVTDSYRTIPGART